MAVGDSESGLGAQKEFDPDRDKEAVEKMKGWEKGTLKDPVMESLGGEPWWRAWVGNGKKQDKKKNQG